MSEPTLGAVKAAQKLHDLGLCITQPLDALARFIDRETGLPELVGALKKAGGSLSNLVWYCENGFGAPEELDKTSWDACCAAFRDLLKADDYRKVVVDARAVIAKAGAKP